ncbi:hypothetical protein M427DRAFT_32157 [Gonapodya prolifera JEL478]|uniref:Uncharacterized protein n=1 Tax=Gonapodya prolifera (strain JEL478) TaxID=1344416 RepID=A0A139AGP0_GONPJ|nr:hypothetical protein M427DRAFT_32157 [Gonapodya prolifera JEL478]|eukprot:KXS15734.1 hypothetical protein M427DRAFT_32157 [Gonapodya prolifera JEL478]
MLSSCGITNVSTVTFYILAFPTLTKLAVDGSALAHDEVSKGLLKLTLTDRPGFRLVAERTIAAKSGVPPDISPYTFGQHPANFFALRARLTANDEQTV